VRAGLPGTGLWAETAAKPVALHLDPGTEDAETYPASGHCEISADGSIGTPYTRGSADRTPPCGIRYLRASGGEPYRLVASITCGLDLRPRPSRTLLRVRVGRGLPRGNSYG